MIIESPHHALSTADLSEEQVREVCWVYRDRLVDLKKDPRLVYGMIFKNVGEQAGASLEHTHSQLIVTPIVPISVGEEMTGSQEFYKYRGRCVFCDMIQQELATEKRIVLDLPGFVAFCPFASRFPFETWILPKLHSSHYENIQKNGIEELARAMKQVITKIELALDRPAYNYIIHTAPFDSQELGHYHWHIEIIPRLTKTAGFEWGTGFLHQSGAPRRSRRFPARNRNRTRKLAKGAGQGRLSKLSVTLPTSRDRFRRSASATNKSHSYRTAPICHDATSTCPGPPQSSADRQLRRVFEQAYQDSYLPFLDVFSRYPRRCGSRCTPAAR